MNDLDAKVRAEIDAEVARLRARAEADPYISIQEVSEQYSISVRTLRREQAAGRMPPRTRRSRRLAYRKADIEEWFKSRMAK